MYRLGERVCEQKEPCSIGKKFVSDRVAKHGGRKTPADDDEPQSQWRVLVQIMTTVVGNVDIAYWRIKLQGAWCRRINQWFDTVTPLTIMS